MYFYEGWQGFAFDGEYWYSSNSMGSGDTDPHLWSTSGEISYGSDRSNDGTYVHYPYRSTWDHVGDLGYLPPDGLIGQNNPPYVIAPLEGDHGQRPAFHFMYAADLRNGEVSGPCEPIELPALPPGEVAETDLPSVSQNRYLDPPPDMPDAACAQTHASWVAYNPMDGLVYSSQSDNISCVNAYAFDPESCELKWVKSLHFRTYWGDLLRINTSGASSHIQGGAFSPSGKLYLVASSDQGGLLIIDSLTGIIVGDRPIDVDMYFHSIPGNSTVEEELEGIEAFDLDPLPNGSSGMWGQVHVGMLDVDLLGTDQLYVKHYCAADLGAF